MARFDGGEMAVGFKTPVMIGGEHFGGLVITAIRLDTFGEPIGISQVGRAQRLISPPGVVRVSGVLSPNVRKPPRRLRPIVVRREVFRRKSRQRAAADSRPPIADSQ